MNSYLPNHERGSTMSDRIDHLTEARSCATSASLAPDAGSAISWLTATCEQTKEDR